MFGLSFWEIALILGAALIVFGPSKLPDLAKNLGKGIREFRKATTDFKATMDDEIHRPEPPPATLTPADHARIAPSNVQSVEVVKDVRADEAVVQKPDAPSDEKV